MASDRGGTGRRRDAAETAGRGYFGRHGRGDSGSVSIETVVLAPIVTACVLMTMQLSLTAFANIAVQSSAHAGAVALARGGDPVAAAAAHLPAYWVGAAQIRRVGDAVEVELDVPTFLTAGEFTVTGYAGAVVEKDVDEIPTSAEAP